MPWRCPACRTEITHDPFDGRPRAGTPYRCHVCRLELQFDDRANRMEIAPFETDHAVDRPEDRRRIAPAPLPTGHQKKD